MKYVVYINTYRSKSRKTPQEISHEINLCRKFINEQPDKNPEIVEFIESEPPKNVLLHDRRYLLDALATLERGDFLVIPNSETLKGYDFLIEIVNHLVMKFKCHYICLNNDELNTNITYMINMYESMFISQRTRRSVRNRKSRGMHHSGRLPYGKRVGPNEQLVWDYEECAVIKCIKELRQAGYSFQKIATTLNAQGYNNRGRPWQNGTVYRMHSREIPAIPT